MIKKMGFLKTLTALIPVSILIPFAESVPASAFNMASAWVDTAAVANVDSISAEKRKTGNSAKDLYLINFELMDSLYKH